MNPVFTTSIREFEANFDRECGQLGIQQQHRVLRMLRAVAEAANELGRKGGTIRDIQIVHKHDSASYLDDTIEIHLSAAWKLTKPENLPARITVSECPLGGPPIQQHHE